MNSSLDINNTKVLKYFQGSLKDFAQKSQDSLESIQLELQRTLEWIDEKVQYWRSEVEYAERSAEDAMYALQQCELNDDDDSYVDCSYEEEALRDAEYNLEEYRRNLEISQKWRVELENAVEEYYKSISPFHNLITDHSDKARSFLNEKFEKYSLVHSGGSANFSDSSEYANYVIGESRPLVPGGGLQAHEKKPHEKKWGHTIEYHIGKSEEYLISRNIDMASSFFDREIAEWAISETLKSKQNEILNFINSNKPWITLKMNLSKNIGFCILNDDNGKKVSVISTHILLFIVKDNLSSLGYKIISSYPIINNYE